MSGFVTSLSPLQPSCEDHREPSHTIAAQAIIQEDLHLHYTPSAPMKEREIFGNESLVDALFPSITHIPQRESRGEHSVRLVCQHFL